MPTEQFVVLAGAEAGPLTKLADYRAAGGFDLFAHERVGTVAMAGVDPARGDGLAAGWKFVDDRHVEVGVRRHGQRSRNGRRGHDELVRQTSFFRALVA